MTIFVAGVHGVGKTFIAKPVCERLGLRHATASELIREERGLASWTENKLVAEVEQNQLALVSAVERIKASGVQLVLDGHFVLRRAPWNHERLPVDVFRALGCRAVVLLTSPVQTLIERLQARKDYSWDGDELQRFCAEEADHGSDVARALCIPLVTLESPGSDAFADEVQRLRR